jgi:acyl carrier protein
MMTTQATNNSTTEKIIELAANQVHCPRETVVPEAEFVADLGFDSLDVAEFIVNMEDAFDIEIPDEDAQHIITVAQAILKVEQARKK